MKRLLIIAAMVISLAACSNHEISVNRDVPAKVMQLHYLTDGMYYRTGIMQIMTVDSLYVPGDTITRDFCRYLIVDIEH
jgi:hypothetical protein